jgi:hypothetical protein
VSDVYEEPSTEGRIYAMVRSLRRNELPRNRHFDAHAGADGAAARRIHRFLRGVERDLRLATRIELTDGEEGQRVLTLELGEVRLRRVVALSPTEFSILAENAENAAFLSRGGPPGAPASSD